MINPNIYFYHASKEEVKSQNIKGVTKFLFTLNKLKSDAFQSACITVGGYDDVADELYEIKEVVEWVKKWVGKFPHALYFLNPEIEAHVYVLGCLGDVHAVSKLYDGKRLSPQEMNALGIAGEPVTMKIFLHDEWYLKMKEGVKNFSQISKDKVGTDKTLEILEYFY
jgi:hypothetical protein